jgi:hypothetical protein
LIDGQAIAVDDLLVEYEHHRGKEDDENDHEVYEINAEELALRPVDKEFLSTIDTAGHEDPPP